MKPEIALRCMRPSDLSFADSLRELAGWNQTIDDWKLLLALSPEGCFVAEWKGSPAGTATTICYGEELAWIGMLLVHPDLQGRGIGRAQLTHCLDHLHRRKIGCIKLDATPAGRRLYGSFGFQEEWSFTRWENHCWRGVAPAKGKELRPYAESDAGPVAQLDSQSFGASRQRLLQRLRGERCQALVHHTNEGIAGYGVLREGARTHYLGPLVAASPPSGVLLINALLARAIGKAILWDIPDANLEAVAYATNFGFTPQRHLVRMFLGSNNHPGDPHQYFAIADPAIG